jgi:hypothetical protein
MVGGNWLGVNSAAWVPRAGREEHARGKPRAANGGSKLPHSTWITAVVMALPNGYIQERFLDCVSRRFAQKQKRGTLRSE